MYVPTNNQWPWLNEQISTTYYLIYYSTTNKQISAVSFIIYCSFCHLKKNMNANLCPSPERKKNIYFLILLMWIHALLLFLIFLECILEYFLSNFHSSRQKTKKKHAFKKNPAKKKITMWLNRNWYYMTARIKALGSKWATLLKRSLSTNYFRAWVLLKLK